jgi:cytochrome c biogenesis protein CcmG, thiol:disulfide interchange protein DsbE
VAVDKRILVGSLGAAVVLSIAGGWALSRSNDGDNVTVDDEVTMTSSGLYLEPGIAVNDPVQGQPLPAVDLRDLNGAEVSTSSLIGQPLVINVWATDCVACRTEMPAFAAVNREFGDKVRFVGVNVAANTESAISFARAKGVHYELLSDQDGELVSRLGIKGIPYTLFVTSDGTIVVQKGIELDQNTIRKTIIDTLLS